MVNINSTIKYILIFIVIIIVAHFLCFNYLKSQTHKPFIYQELQYRCINKCSSKNKFLEFVSNNNDYIYRLIIKKKYKVNEKLLIINSKVYNDLLNVIVTIDPIKKDIFKNEFFSLRMFSCGTKKTIKSIGIYGIIYFTILEMILNHKFILDEIKSINICYYTRLTLSFLYNNKLYIIAFISLFLFIYSICKDKFTNKIIERIQDDELTNIIKSLQQIYTELVKLRITLLKNIRILLSLTKNKGNFVFLYRTVANKYDFCKYSMEDNKLILEENNYEILKNEFNTFNTKIGDIDVPLNKVKELFEEYQKSDSFYSLYAINKHFKKLNIFDIEYLIKNKNCLIDKNYIDNLIGIIVDDIDTNQTDSEMGKLALINKLNENINIANEELHYAILQSIEESIKIDRFIKTFNKAMSLKKHRNRIPMEEFLSNIK